MNEDDDDDELHQNEQ
jgi:hypothetical protein